MVARSKAATGTSPGAFQSGKRTPRQAANAEVHIAIVKAATRLMDEFAAIVKPVDLSSSQYNVLRILRGAGPDGATCGEVIDRLIQRDPDVTRLLDRLEKRGLIERGRDLEDRRVVRTRITQSGLDLLASLDDAVNDLHDRLVGNLNEKQVADLRRLIEEVTQ
jgi:DNA-binding MarR family transcriptional regulator